MARSMRATKVTPKTSSKKKEPSKELKPKKAYRRSGRHYTFEEK